MKLRLKAFFVHLLISGVIFLCIMMLVYFSWFPGQLVKLGAFQGLTIVVLVDLVLGPVLTFVVFNPKKKTLKVDLSLIALLQFSGLIYGVVQLESQRVVAQVLMDDQLHIVHKAEMVEVGYSVADLREKFGRLPVKAFYNVVEDSSLVKTELRTIAAIEGQPQYQVKYYLLMDWAKDDPVLKSRLDYWLSRLKFDEKNSCYWLPLKDKYVEGNVCFSPAEGVVSVEPY